MERSTHPAVPVSPAPIHSHQLEDGYGLASEAYEQILKIQSLDMSIAQLGYRAANHPARAGIADIDAALAEHDAATAAVSEKKHELERTQKRLQDEVALIEAKRLDVDGKLYGGKVTASKELLALQDEARSLLGRQTQTEDDDLVIMEQLEEVDGELAGLASARADFMARRADHEEDLEAALGEIDAEIATAKAERETSASEANADLLNRYEALRAEFDGQPVARLVGSSCDGCHIQLSAVAVDRIGKMPEDAVVTCEECGRLLVR